MDPIPSPRNSKSPLSTNSGGSGRQSIGGGDRSEKRAVPDEFTRIEPSEIQWGEQIGGGAYGTVHKAKIEVAVKRLRRKEGSAFSEKDIRAFEEEVAVMRKIYHPNIVLLMGAWFSSAGDELLIITELLHSDLESLLIRDNAPISLLRRLEMALGAALGMNWLHQSKPRIIHRDLKLSNLLIDQTYTVKVCDFGLTRIMDHDAPGLEGRPEGTPLYMAPEVMNGGYDEKCDVYSFAIVLWEVATQKHPFPDKKTTHAIMFAVMRDQRPEIPKEIPAPLATLITSCWAKDPKMRPTFQQIVTSLEDTILGLGLPEMSTQKWWRQTFGAKTEIPWKDFEKAIKKLNALVEDAYTTVKLEALKAIVGGKSGVELHVTMTSLAKAVSWFGPIATLLEAKPWFHGATTKEETAIRLQSGINQPTDAKMKGSFLVRFSEQTGADPTLGFLAISFTNRENGSLQHVRIQHQAGTGYKVGEHVFPNLSDLVAFFSFRNDITIACPGSPYAQIFGYEEPTAASKKEVGAYGEVDC